MIEDIKKIVNNYAKFIADSEEPSFLRGAKAGYTVFDVNIGEYYEGSAGDEGMHDYIKLEEDIKQEFIKRGYTIVKPLFPEFNDFGVSVEFS
jgi:hypothetical protein